MPIRICFVCLGNICRSPTAHGIFAHQVAQAGLDAHIAIDSAGTGDWHVGEQPDLRARAEAQRHGIHLDHRAQHFGLRDFSRYDYIFAMDRQNQRDLLRLTSDPLQIAKVQLFRAFDPTLSHDASAQRDVPDPYNQAPALYAEVFAICERTCTALLAHLRQHHGF